MSGYLPYYKTLFNQLWQYIHITSWHLSVCICTALLLISLSDVGFTRSLHKFCVASNLGKQIQHPI